MREVFVNQDHARVGFYKSVLDEAGVPNFIRNELTNHSMTEIPLPMFYPALCVLHDEDYDRAMELLRPIYEAAPEAASPWLCPTCREEVPGNFDSCWQCGGTRSDAPTANLPR